MQVATDTVTSFLIDRADVRGRLVRLGPIADTVLSRYQYPPAVTQVLGELLLVAAMLGSNLKHQGIFTIQIRGEGLIKLLVVDAVYGGQLRGFAEVTDDSRAAIEKLGEHATPAQLFGDNAYFAITLDPGEGMQRYQGVVGLEGETITEALTHYFTHSQQVEVLFKLALARVDGNWVAGGLMIERLPAEGENVRSSEVEDGWRYANAIAATVKTEELTNPMLDAPALLYRLYHEEGVWVEEPHPLTTGCRCSRQRIEDLLLGMPDTDRADMVVDGVASVHCQFCNTTEKFTPAQLGLSVQ